MLCKIGAVEVWRILEIHGPFIEPEKLFPNAGPDVARQIEALVPGGVCAQTGRLILPVQGFLLRTPSHNILVDACVGNDKTVEGHPNWHRRSGTRFMAGLTAAGVTPEDIDYVLCTHLHVDHVGWNTRLSDGRWVPTFANARHLLPDPDVQAQRMRNSPHFKESVLPVIEADQAEMVGPDHMLGDHVRLIPTPGHTPGHVSVLVRDGGTEAIITGDAIHTTAQCRHPEWHFRFDDDPVAAVAARKALLEMAVDKGCLVLGSHFALPSTGRVCTEGEAYRWQP